MYELSEILENEDKESWICFYSVFLSYRHSTGAGAFEVIFMKREKEIYEKREHGGMVGVRSDGRVT